MELKFKNTFKKNVKKLVSGKKNLKNKVDEVILDFVKNLFLSKFYRKPLKNLGKNIHELEIGGDVRILVEVLVVDDLIIFLNIGTHSSLELSSSKKIKI